MQERKKVVKKELQDLYDLMRQGHEDFIEDNGIPHDHDSIELDEDEQNLMVNGIGPRYARWEVRVLRRMDMIDMGVQ